MSTPHQRRFALGFRMAKLLTGNEPAALAALEQTRAELAAHPSAEDPHHGDTLFWAALRRRCLATPARCELPGPLAELHAAAEPGRSLVTMRLLGVADPGTIAAAVGVPLRTPEAEIDPRVFSAHATTLAPSPQAHREIEDLAAALTHASRHGTLRVRNPATIAAALGLLLLVGLLAWHLTGQVGRFPDEAVKIATLAGKALESEFGGVDSPLADIPDWFALNGYDGFRIPEGLGNLRVVGVRSFRHEGEPVAQAAILDGDRHLFAISFPAQPFGIDLPPPGSWRVKQAGRYALAIQEIGVSCFMLSMPGSVNDLRNMLRASREGVAQTGPAGGGNDTGGADATEAAAESDG